MNIHILRFTSLVMIFFLQLSCGGKGGTNEDFAQDSSSNSNLTANSSTNSNSSLSADAAALAQKIDAYIESNQDEDLAGLSVLILKNRSLVYSRSKGMADISADVKISSHTGFNLASVSKPFTAIAIMQLVEKGQLHLSDSVLDYIPELPPSWRKITIEHLLTHRSGIYDIINDKWGQFSLNGMTHASLLNHLSRNPDLEFDPGTQGDYSNTGFMLLATLIERRTGLTFPDYMALNVFGPANMKGSYISDENQTLKSGDALNYARLRTYYGITTYFKGSMAQVSSIDDFFNFFDALHNEKLISAQTLSSMAVPRGAIKVSNLASGYGFFLVDDLMIHGGDWDGAQADISINRKTGVDWVILSNSGRVGRSNIDAIKRIIFTTPF